MMQRNYYNLIAFACLVWLFSVTLSADPYPPEWDLGTVNEPAGPIHFSPVAWPVDAAPITDCLFDCVGWTPYSRFQNDIADPRTQDPSNGGTRPQNYVNIASSCIDKNAPSIYYHLYKDPSCDADANECDGDVLMFRWRVEQVANTYATGPQPGSYGSTDPWNSALWTVLFDVDGDGYRDLAAHLDGSSGSPSTPIDMIAGIWGNIPTQSIDYINDPNINIIAHNPTGFIAGDGSTILNFQDALNPTDLWPNGSSETVWDYGTSRAKKVYTNSCTEYFIDYQIPVRMLNASSSGPDNNLNGPKITRSSPISMLFCTANSLNNPFQKDCALNKSWIADPNKPGPFGDYLSFNKEVPYTQPIVSSVTAEAPLSCSDNYSLSAKVQDTLAVINGEVTHSIQSVDFYYWYDKNGNGQADAGDTGSAWELIGSSSSPKSGSLNTWIYDWDSSSLLKGRYLVGVQAIDDKTLHDDGVPDAPVDNRTFSYISGDDTAGTENYIYSNGWVWDGESKSWTNTNPVGWVDTQESSFPPHATAISPDNTTDWYGNPNITGVQIAQLGVDLAVNTCGVAPTIVKSADKTNLTIGETVTFTLTIANPANNPNSITLTEFKDIIPNGFTYNNGTTIGIFGTANPTINSQTLTWSGSTVVINAGDSVSLSFSATAPNDTGSYSNNSSAITSFGEINSNTIDLGVGSPRLTISKLSSSLSLNEGDPVTYTITYSNDSPIAANNVVITDQIQDGLTYVSCTDNCTCSGACGVGDTITWNIGSLDPGLSSASVSFTASVTNPYPNSASVPLVNTAIIDSDETLPTNASASSYVNVPRPELSITKVSNVSLVDPNADVIFTLNYNNSGLASATGVTLTDIIPSGFAFQSCSDFCTNPGVGVNGTVSWNIATLNASTSGSVTLTVKANDPFDGTDNPIVNTATLSSNETTSVNDTASVGIKQIGQVCNRQYLRSETKDVDFDDIQRISNAITPTGAETIIPVFIGGLAGKVEIARFYQDPVSSTQVIFDGTSTLSGQLNYDKSDLLGGTANAGSDLIVETYDYNPVTGITVLIATVTFRDNGAPSPPVTLTGVTASNSLEKGHRFLTIMYAEMLNSSFSTTVELSADSVNSYVEICSNPPVNLTLDKAVDQSSVAVTGTNRTLTYTLNYSNTSSTTDATGVVLTDTIPSIAGVTFNSCSVAGSTHFTGCSENAGVITFHGGAGNPVNIIAGGNGEVNVVINIPDDLTGSSTIDNSSSISSTQTDSITSTASTLIEGSGQSGSPDITISKTVNDSSVVIGQTITYTLTVLNAGGSAATNVLVTDDFPEDTYYTYGTCSTAKGSCSETPAGTLSWNVGTLNAGSSATLTFTMIVGANPPSGLTEMTNNASVVDDNYCTGAAPASCNSENVIVTISTNPNLTISKTVSPAGPYIAGDTLTYSLVVNNTGSGAADNVKITDPIQDYISYIGGSLKIDGAAKTDQNGDDTAYFDSIANQTVFETGTLAAGGSTTLKFDVSIGDTLPNGSTDIDNTATVSSSNAVSRESSITVSASSSPALSILKTGNASHPFPASRLSSDVTSGSTSISVTDSSQLSVGQYLKIANDITKITAINGNVITLNLALTADAATGDLLLSSLTYSMIYQNTGTSNASNVVITDTLPASFLYVNSSATADTHPAVGSSGNVVWNIGDVDADGNGTVQLTVIPTTIGSNINTVTLTDATFCITSATDCTDDQQTNIGGLSVTKSTSTPLVSASTGAPLNTASYMLTVENTTYSAINNVEVTDALSKGFAYKPGTTEIDGSSAADPTFEVNDTTSSFPKWTVNIPANTSLEIRFEAEIATEVGAATYQNEVALGNIAATIGVTGFDALSTTQEDVTIIGTDKGVVEGYVFKDDGSSLLALDANDTRYANVPVVLSANGEACWPIDAANAYSGDCYVSYTDNNGFFSLIVPIGDWTVDVIEGEGDLPVSLSLTVGTDTTDITVLSQTSHSDLNGFDQVSDISGTVYNDIDASGTLTIGDSTLSGVTIELWDDSDGDGLPDGSNAITTTTSDGNGNYLFADIPPAQYVIVEIDPTDYISTNDSDGGVDQATYNQIAINILDSDSLNNNFYDQSILRADLSLSKTVALSADVDDSGTISVGDTVNFTITVSNAGPDNATNVKLSDSLPEGYSYVNDNSGGSYNSASGVWQPGTLNSLTSASLIISARILNSGIYKNTAQIIASDLIDPDSNVNNDDGDQSEDDEDAVTPDIQAYIPPPALSIDDITVNENAGTASFTVTISETSAANISFSYGTGNITAIAGSDYNSTSGTGTIIAGSTTTTITVTIINDSIDESDETFNVLLSNPLNAVINDGTGLATILDDGTPDVIPADPKAIPVLNLYSLLLLILAMIGVISYGGYLRERC